MSGLIFIGFVVGLGLAGIGLYVVAMVAKKYVDNIK